MTKSCFQASVDIPWYAKPSQPPAMEPRIHEAETRPRQAVAELPTLGVEGRSYEGTRANAPSHRYVQNMYVVHVAYGQQGPIENFMHYIKAQI